MPGPSDDLDAAVDQAGAEAFDETMTDGESAELRSFEELDTVLDETARDGDADDDEPLALDADEFDEDAVGDEDFEDSESDEVQFLNADETDLADEEQDFDDDVLEGENGIDGLDQVADAGLVTGGEDDFTNFQSKGVDDAELKRMGYANENIPKPAAGAEPRTIPSEDAEAKAQEGTGKTPEDVEDNRNRHTEKNLDKGIEETFPASDPVSISPGAD